MGRRGSRATRGIWASRKAGPLASGLPGSGPRSGTHGSRPQAAEGRSCGPAVLRAALGDCLFGPGMASGLGQDAGQASAAYDVRRRSVAQRRVALGGPRYRVRGQPVCRTGPVGCPVVSGFSRDAAAVIASLAGARVCVPDRRVRCSRARCAGRRSRRRAAGAEGRDVLAAGGIMRR
jgi:hypothetical protein